MTLLDFPNFTPEPPIEPKPLIRWTPARIAIAAVVGFGLLVAGAYFTLSDYSPEQAKINHEMGRLQYKGLGDIGYDPTPSARTFDYIVALPGAGSRSAYGRVYYKDNVVEQVLTQLHKRGYKNCTIWSKGKAKGEETHYCHYTSPDGTRFDVNVSFTADHYGSVLGQDETDLNVDIG